MQKICQAKEILEILISGLNTISEISNNVENSCDSLQDLLVRLKVGMDIICQDETSARKFDEGVMRIFGKENEQDDMFA